MAADVKSNPLARLFQLWGVHARMDFIWMTRDLKSFLTWQVADGIFGISAITGAFLLAARFNGIGAWSRAQVLFLLAYAMIVDGLLDTFFGFNVKMISRRIGRGQMDHILIQPQPVWIALLTEGFTPFSGSAMVLPGIGLMVWANSRLPQAPPAGALVLNLLSSCVVVLAYQFAWGSLAFWAPRAAEEINSRSMSFITQLKSFPLDGVRAGLVGGMMTVVPVGFAAWFPCRALLGLSTNREAALLTPLAAIACGLIAIGLFHRGMRYYGRTGSQRYSGWGHRS